MAKCRLYTVEFSFQWSAQRCVMYLISRFKNNTFSHLVRTKCVNIGEYWKPVLLIFFFDPFLLLLSFHIFIAHVTGTILFTLEYKVTIIVLTSDIGKKTVFVLETSIWMQYIWEQTLEFRLSISPWMYSRSLLWEVCQKKLGNG